MVLLMIMDCQAQKLSCGAINYVSKNICIVVWNKLITYMQTIRYMMTIKIKSEKKNVMNPSHLTRKIS